MKKLILGLIMVTATLAGCGNNSNETTNNETATTDSVKPETKTAMPADMKMGSIADIINDYISLKNAFTVDNTNDAASGGNTLLAAFTNFDTTTLTVEKLKSYNDIADDAKEHAEHIGANSGNIVHQREHFILLSKDMADLIKTFGNGGQTLYKDFCPMANDGKGAIWISENKDIKNPYLGKTMPTCGSVKETIR